MYDKSTARKLPKCASHAVVGNKVSFLNYFGGHSNMTSHTFIETYLKLVEFTGKLEVLLYIRKNKPKKY